MSDPVIDHPDYYNWIPGIECIDVIEHMTYNIGNAVKYLWRHGRKGSDTLADLQKAKWYIEREISRLQEAKHEK